MGLKLIKLIFYSFQLFDEENYLNKNPMKYIFSTEGHIFPITKQFRVKPWKDSSLDKQSESMQSTGAPIVKSRSNSTYNNVSKQKTMVSLKLISFCLIFIKHHKWGSCNWRTSQKMHNNISSPSFIIWNEHISVVSQ